MPTSHTCRNCGDWIHFVPRHRFREVTTQRDIQGGIWKHTLPNNYCKNPFPKLGVTREDSLREQGKKFEER